MEALNTQTSVPLYSQLAEQLRQDIYTGRFTQGEKIPSEFELSRLYNVSRSTVRKAISYWSVKIFWKRRMEKGLLYPPQK